MLMTFIGIFVNLTFYISNLILHTEQTCEKFENENETNAKYSSKRIAFSHNGSRMNSVVMPLRSYPYLSVLYDIISSVIVTRF